MRTTSIRLLAPALAFLVLVGPPAAAQDYKDEATSLEAMRREAEKAIAERKRAIVRQVDQAIIIFKNKTLGLAEQQLATHRRSIADLGPAAVGVVLDRFTKASNDEVIGHLGAILLDMVERELVPADRVAPALQPLVGDAKPARAAMAALFLGRVGWKDAIPALRKEVAAPRDVEVLAAALGALGRLGDTESFPYYEAGLEHEDPRVRRAAITVFGQIGRPADVKVMVPLVDDGDEEVAIAAIRALARVGSSTVALRKLHDTLKHSDRRYVRTAIESIEEIDNLDISKRHLRELVRSRGRNYESRKRAALALNKMGDDWGKDELAKPFASQASRNPKVARHRTRLAEFYFEFSDYKSAAKEFDRAVDIEKQYAEQNRLRIMAARCYARIEKFKKASDFLTKAIGKDWSEYANDPDFAEMRQHRKYADNFVAPAAEGS